MLERRKLAAQLVRIQAMIWSAEDPVTRGRLQRTKLEIERQLAAVENRRVHSAPIREAVKPVKPA